MKNYLLHMAKNPKVGSFTWEIKRKDLEKKLEIPKEFKLVNITPSPTGEDQFILAFRKKQGGIKNEKL